MIIGTPESGIIKEGLILWLDTKNDSSYSGSGSTWYDLSDSRQNATLVGSVPIVDGGFYTAYNQTSNYIQLPISPLTSLSSNIWTAEIVITLNSTSNTTYFMSMANTAENNLFIMEKSFDIIRPWAASADGSAFTFTSGETLHLVMRKPEDGGNGMRLFKNGQIGSFYTGGGTNNDQTTVEGWVMNQEQDSVLGGFQGTQATDMKTHEVRLYNRFLEPEEISQNFEAIRGRYAI